MARIKVVLGERQRVVEEAKQRIKEMYAKKKKLEALQRKEERIKLDLQQITNSQSE